MPLFRLLLAGLLAVLSAHAPALANESRRDGVVELAGFVSVTMQCEGVTPPRIRIVRQPRFGRLERYHPLVAPTYKPGNVFYPCNKTPRRGTAVRYVRDGSGRADDVAINVVYMDGEIQSYRYHIPVATRGMAIVKSHRKVLYKPR